MSPIEHEWDLVARDSRPAASKDELWLGIQAIWNSLPKADIQNILGHQSLLPTDLGRVDEERASPVVRASESRPEGLGSMPPNTLRRTENVLVKSVGPKVLWVEPRVQWTGEYFPPIQFHGKIVEVEIGAGAIYRPFPS
ncbi:hypothetical protein TNCV_999711 [Trichonephila clavipes]|nr:hypothetical protein TNCV_999711 [Trichonephila clavipes]